MPVLIFALLIFACLAASSASATIRVEFGAFCTPNGTGNGECKTAKGLAVNGSGAGGVSPGDVYVVDNANNRIQEFSAAGGFIRAWGFDVDESTPGTGFEICPASDQCKAGVRGEGAGQLSGAQGIAVDQETGTVYVTDNGNRRVDAFSATGAFEGAFGWSVDAAAPAEELQFCTVVTGCKAGVAGAAAGQFSSLTNSMLAVDPSSGDIYVPDQGNVRIDQFDPTFGAGEITAISFRRALGWDVNAEDPREEPQECTTATGCQKGQAGNGPGQFIRFNPTSIAVDADGAIYAVNVVSSGNCSAAEPCRVEKFDPDGSFAGIFGPSSGECQLAFESGAAAGQEAFDIAVDHDTGHVVVLKKDTASTYRIVEYDSGGVECSVSPPGPTGVVGATNVGEHGLALGAGERVYANGGQVVTILGPVPPPGAEIRPVTESTATTATFHGVVTVPSLNGNGVETTYHFEYSADNGLTWLDLPVPDASAGSSAGPVQVSEPVTGLQPHLTYRVRLAARTGATTTSGEEFFTTAAAPPAVSGMAANPVTQTSARLIGFVNPNNTATTYHFEYGTSTSYGSETPSFEAFVGSGGAPVKVAANISGLVAGTTYHFRIVASSAAGTTEGPDQELTTLDALGLPDGRAYELVSPPDKGANGRVFPVLPTQLEFQAAADGQSAFYPVANGLPGATAGGNIRYVAGRGASGWRSVQVSAPAMVPPRGGEAGQDPASFVHWMSPNLSCGLLESPSPLSADTPPSDVEGAVTNLYSWRTDGSYTLISNRPPGNPGLVPGLPHYYDVAGAADDCSRVYFQTPYELLPGASGLYEWSNGALSDAGLLPDGSVPAGEVGIGGGPGAEQHLNAVSRDGSRFFFTEVDAVGRRTVFVHRSGAASLNASRSHTATPDLGARYETASPDGSHVFFAANYGLTSPSSSGPSANCGGITSFGSGPACDLYDYDVETEELTDISADANPADTNGASVEGVLGVSDDGSYVYFAALGQLLAGEGNTYLQNQGSGAANVYLAHAGRLHFVATVNDFDLGIGNANSADLMRRVRGYSAQVTPDGGHLLFPASADVTGYDSGGASEAYLYSTATESVQCISCREDGRPSVAGHQNQVLRTSPGSLPEQWYFPRSLSDDGSRAFFTMPDALAAGAVEGNNNIYEWSKGQVSVLVTSDDPQLQYQDASANGDDVFFTTNRRLVPADTDSTLDLYDVRVGGGVPAAGEAAPPPCGALLEGACQGPLAPPPPSGPSPATANFAGPGNAVPPAAKPKRHRHHRRKKHHRRRRKRAAPARHRAGRHANADRRAAK